VTKHNIGKAVLPSGLRIVTEELPTVRSAAFGVWVNVGSRDESPSVAGASHFLEHLLFKGTKRRTAMEISSMMEAVGGEMNAFTGKEYTCFYARVLDENLPLAIDVISDLITSSVVVPSDVDAERGVVLEEIHMRDDDPSDLIHDVFTETLYGDTPLGRPILGSVESINGMSRNSVNGYYKRRYRPSDLVVAVAGNFKHDEVVRQAKRAFAADGFMTERAKPANVRSASSVNHRGLGEYRVLSKETEQAHVLLGMPGLSRTDERRFALGVLNTALGGGMSSRLFQEIREKRGLAYSVYSYSQQFAGSGLFGVYAGCQPSKVHEVLKITRDLLADVAANGLREEELERAKGQARGGLVLGLEDTGSRMSRLGKSELMFGDLKTIDQMLAEIDAVTAQDVRGVASALLVKRPTLAVIGPFKGRAASKFQEAVA
jgi:predicted Zn-dependent peptidase